MSSGILTNTGHLLENLVFTALRRRTSEIFYHKKRSNREVDFITGRRDGEQMLVQVCESLSSPKTRTREIVALTEAMEELSIPGATIVTRSEAERIEVQSGVIDVMPAWRFLLKSA